MSKANRGWCVLAALLALVLRGQRVMVWQSARRQDREREMALARERDMALAGEGLFKREWRPNDPLCPCGDGLGPVFNARSCLACHNQAGPGGGGGLEHNVTAFTDERLGSAREGVVHAFSIGTAETLRDIDPDLPAVSQPSLADLLIIPGKANGRLTSKIPQGVHISQRNTPALFGAGLIDELPVEVIVNNARATCRSGGRVPCTSDGRLGRLGWKGQKANLADFVQAACASELGLGNPGHPQPRPLGQPDYEARGLDLTLRQCLHRKQLDALTGPFAYAHLLGDREAVGALTPTLDHIVIDRTSQVAEDARAIQVLRQGVPVVAFVNNHFAGYIDPAAGGGGLKSERAPGGSTPNAAPGSRTGDYQGGLPVR
jgi:hypothetical protein